MLDHVGWKKNVEWCVWWNLNEFTISSNISFNSWAFKNCSICLSWQSKGQRKCIQGFDVGQDVGCIWELTKFIRKKKTNIVLGDVGWSFFSIKLFVQHFMVHPTKFSFWMHLSTEGHKQDKREEAKMASKKEKDSNVKRFDQRWDFLAY